MLGGGSHRAHPIPPQLVSWKINAIVREKVISVPCGEASQRIKWLGAVAIARWDEVSYQGWRELGERSRPIRAPRREKAKPRRALRPRARAQASVPRC